MKTLRWLGIYALCLVTVIFVRLGLWLTKYQKIRSVLVRPCDQTVDLSRKATVLRVAHGIARTANIVPKASCLTRAIACQAILSWKSIPTTISIGALKDETGTFKAHAWVIWNDQIVLDGTEDLSANFNKLLDLPTPGLTTP